MDDCGVRGTTKTITVQRVARDNINVTSDDAQSDTCGSSRLTTSLSAADIRVLVEDLQRLTRWCSLDS